MPAHKPTAPTVPPAVLDALRRADARGAHVLSVCSGAFVLGEAGLLDDRECTTHWRYADELQARFPRAKVACNALYVHDGNLLTSAGTAAGIDACLHLVRQRARLGDRHEARPPDGRPAAPRRRPGAVRRGADRRVRPTRRPSNRC